MKDIKTYITESCKKCKHQTSKKVWNPEYKQKDKKLKQILDKKYKEFKKKNKLNESKEYSEFNKEEVLDAISSIVQNAIDDWKTYWEEPEDMERDLETLTDWFWNELDSHISDIADWLDYEDENKLQEYIENEIADDVNDVIDNLGSETDEYMRDAREWNNDSYGYGDDDDDDDY